MEFVPGALAGATTALLGYPFDTIKTKMQVINQGNTTNIFFKTIRNNGFLSLYRGVTTPLITNTIKRSYQYYLFEYLNQKKLNPYFSGAIAGVSGSIIGCPMHVLKANMQITDKTMYKNTPDLISKIYKKEGWKGFYKGFNINLIKDSIYGGVYLGNYVLLKKYIPKLIYKKDYINISESKKKLSHFLSGGFSAVFVWGIFIPLDHIETAIQTNRGYQYVVDKVKKNNILILWRGSIPILVRIFPVSAISMLIYEFSLSLINKKNI